MSTTEPLGQHLSDTLTGLFSRTDNGWFTPITVAMEGLTAEQAAIVPAPRFNSVWAVVSHVRFWHEYALRRLRGLPVDRQALGAEDGWPPAGVPVDEPAWQAAREQLIALNGELAAFVAELSDVEFELPIAPGRDPPANRAGPDRPPWLPYRRDHQPPAHARPVAGAHVMGHGRKCPCG